MSPALTCTESFRGLYLQPTALFSICLAACRLASQGSAHVSDAVGFHVCHLPAGQGQRLVQHPPGREAPTFASRRERPEPKGWEGAVEKASEDSCLRAPGLAAPLEVIRATQSTTGGVPEIIGGQGTLPAHSILKCCLFPRTRFHLRQAHLLSGIPLLGEKRQEVEEGPASPRVQGHTGITVISDGGVWGSLKPVCVLSSEPWPRPHPRGSD